ncbi:MAG: hypothetical protein DMF06_05095 [Verrucomicrobia bacterium]|nr:MAG: hypothetical protein DMF06_05095 [Verrucomicrobiota bacterium]
MAKRAEALSFGDRGRLPADWHGMCSNESCLKSANYTVEGVKFCKHHAADAALATLMNEESA